MAEQQEQQQGKEYKRPSLKNAVMGAEPITDRLMRFLPEAVRDLFQDKRRQLLFYERKLQRRLINEFNAQARELEPVLRARGRLVGEAVVEALTSDSSADLTYAQAVAQSLQNTSVAGVLPVRELAATLDPLLNPFIDPFVEGIKAPINDKANEFQRQLTLSFVATAAGGVLAGILIGRFLPRGDGGGRGR